MHCPSCNAHIGSLSSTNTEQILCTLINEGGRQENLDILPLLTEELYLKAYPEERRGRAFLEFCKEGDVQAIVDLLNDSSSDSEDAEEDEDGDAPRSPALVLYYQDPMGTKYSGLHIAVINAQVEVVWLLLFLCSSRSLSLMPEAVSVAAKRIGAVRLYRTLFMSTDIRLLRDADGLLAADHVSRSALRGTFDPRVLIPEATT